MSVAAGGTQAFQLAAPPGTFDVFLLLGSTSGTSPGTPTGGFVVPLNLDSYLLHTLLSPNTAPLATSFGVLPPSGIIGGSVVSFTLPPAFDPSLVGMTVHHAYLVANLLSGYVTFVSNAVPLSFVP